MSFQAPTIAIFGATGGVANSVLVNALRSGFKVVALARTPSKLTNQLKTQNISEETISSQLTIIPGDALNITAVKSTLTANTPNHLVSHIVTGLGGAPQFQWAWNPLSMITIDNPNICANAATTLVAALQEIYAESPALAQNKPKITYVSTTGVSDGPEDVPVGLQFLYHQLLAVPHLDKKDMEKVYTQAAVFSGVIGMRPTLLTGGINADEGIGSDKIRVGRYKEPARGWTICRADVGQWIWINAVSDEGRRAQWENERVTLTN